MASSLPRISVNPRIFREPVIDLRELVVDFRELVIDLRETLVNMPAEVDEVFSKRIEARRCGSADSSEVRSSVGAEVAEFPTERADVAVSRPCEHTRSRRVLLTCLYAPGQVTHLILKSGDPRLQIAGLHVPSVPAFVHRPTHQFWSSPAAFCFSAGVLSR